MNFNVETSRNQKITALQRAEEIFRDRLSEKTDALFLSSERNRILAFTGLRYYAPVCMHIINDQKLYDYLSRFNGDLLFKNGEEIILFVDNEEQELSEELTDEIKKICERIFLSPGTINGNGELELDLKGYHIGSHYGVNLLLGDRSEYADCLQSTPKSVVDELGRGSFRGKREKQVLATRYVLSPDENGEPANRQFYITENGRQIFYSLDVNSNIKSAKCLHSQNRTIITYETECGLRIIRTIFLLPQEKDMPSAVEVQRIRIENLSDKPRDLRIVATGMFGITDPGTLAGDIVFANVVVESELYYKNGRPIAMTAHHQPKECDSEKRFAMLLVNGEGMDEYCSSLYDFMGSGSLERPEMISRLSNAHSRRQAAFFAMAKSFRLEDSVNIDTFIGMSDTDEESVKEQFDLELENLYEKYRDPNNLNSTLSKLIQDNDRYYSDRKSVV